MPMPRRLFFLTSNQGKLREAEHHLATSGWMVEQFLLDGKVPELIEPQVDSLEEVALSKLVQAIALLESQGRSSDAVIVEDSGLFIHAFPGFPGVFSSHIFKSLGCAGILRLMGEERSAHFEAVAVLWDGEKTRIGRGVCRGRIAMEMIEGEGFGFDPIFIPDDLEDGSSSDGKPFGAIPTSLKHCFSHRRLALDELFNSGDE
ncbi:MAG: non-canonical purine NTP pyrophosphatase [Candidatus Poseidoniaceae archaeon]|nr:non-canonical purine NTP pyrophosphatase [Candidatus Poseidoniaceae archaeon]